jgi:hypothetical protein
MGSKQVFVFFSIPGTIIGFRHVSAEKAADTTRSRALLVLRTGNSFQSTHVIYQRRTLPSAELSCKCVVQLQDSCKIANILAVLEMLSGTYLQSRSASHGT